MATIAGLMVNPWVFMIALWLLFIQMLTGIYSFNNLLNFFFMICLLYKYILFIRYLLYPNHIWCLFLDYTITTVKSPLAHTNSKYYFVPGLKFFDIQIQIRLIFGLANSFGKHLSIKFSHTMRFFNKLLLI